MKIPKIGSVEYVIMLFCKEGPKQYIDIAAHFKFTYETDIPLTLHDIEQMVADRWLRFDSKTKEYILTEAGLRESNRIKDFYKRVK